MRWETALVEFTICGITELWYQVTFELEYP